MIHKKLIIPIFISLLVIGIVAGMKIQNAISDDKISEQVKKFADVLNITSRYYVDDIDSQKLTEAAIKGLLEELDPHSSCLLEPVLTIVIKTFVPFGPLSFLGTSSLDILMQG